MKKSKKTNKFIYGLGAALIVTVPVLSVVSCGTGDEQKKLDEITTEQILDAFQLKVDSTKTANTIVQPKSLENIKINNIEGVDVSISNWQPNELKGKITFTANISKNNLTKNAKLVPISGYKLPPARDLDIDMKNIHNAQELIDMLNNEMHFRPNKPTDIIGRPTHKPDTTDYLDPNGYPLTVDQYTEIASTVTQDISFSLTFGDMSQVFTSNLNKDAIIIADSINNMLANQSKTGGADAVKDMTDRMQEALQGANPNFVTYVAALSPIIGISSIGYLSFPEAAWNAYNDQLTEWTNFISEINDSTVYKSWLTENSNAYLIPKIGAVADPTTGHISKNDLIDPSTIDNTIDEGQTAINFDDSNKERVKGYLLPGTPAQPTKMNNLAVQADYSMQDLFDFS